MARRIEHRTRSSWDAKTVYTTLVDTVYLAARLARLGGNGAQLTAHTDDGDRVSYTLRHGVSANNLPPAVRTLLGGDLKIDRAETWRPEAAGGYVGTVTVTIPGMPGELSGTMRLTDRPGQAGSEVAGSELVVDGTVRIPIPLVGGKIEESVAEQLGKLLDAEHRFAEEWLTDHQR